MRSKGEKIVISIVLLGFALMAFQKWQVNQRQLEHERAIAIQVEIRKMMDHRALGGPSVSDLIAKPPPPPIKVIDTPLQISAPRTSIAPSPNDISDQFERDQMRREIDSLKRQADLDRMNRDFQRRDDEQKARRKELEHSLGLDHPQ